MKKIVIATALLLIPSFLPYKTGGPSLTPVSLADKAQGVEESEQVENKVVTKNDENVSEEIYEIYEIFDETVTVRFVDTTDNSIPDNTKSEFTVKKSDFPANDLKLGDQYRISHSGQILTSYPGQFAKIYEIKREAKVSIELPENKDDWSFGHEGKTYKYTGFESGVYSKTWQVDGYITDPKFSETPYRKGADDSLLELYINDSWVIFSNGKLKKDEIPAGVYQAIYGVSNVDRSLYKVDFKFLDTDESLFKALPKNKNTIFSNAFDIDSFKVGEEYKIWHSLPDPNFTEADFDNYYPEAYRLESTERIYDDFVIKQIGKNKITLNKIDSPMPEFILYKSDLAGLEIKKGDVLNISYNGELSDDYPFTFHKLYEISKVPADRKLALSVFNNLVRVNVANMLLEKTPKSISSIKDELKTTVNNSDKLVDDSFKHFLGKDELTEADRNEAILILMRHKYNKKIETAREKEVALAIFNNIITVDAANTLLYASPKTSTALYWELVGTIDNSRPLIKESLDYIK